jgi:hypothetical protein
MVKPVCVNNKYRREAIDLQPYGNTISVETTEDNPFTQAQDVEVVTQQSGGMAGPDPRMRSKAIRRHPLTGLPMKRAVPGRGGKVVPGKVAASQFRAPAHLQHRGFVPGLGDDTAPAGSTLSTISQAVGQAAGAASTIVGARYNSQAEAARARAAAAQAQAEQARTETSRINALLDNSMINAGQHKTLVYGLLAVGALALGAAFVMKSKGKKRR